MTKNSSIFRNWSAAGWQAHCGPWGSMLRSTGKSHRASVLPPLTWGSLQLKSPDARQGPMSPLPHPAVTGEGKPGDSQESKEEYRGCTHLCQRLKAQILQVNIKSRNRKPHYLNNKLNIRCMAKMVMIKMTAVWLLTTLLGVGGWEHHELSLHACSHWGAQAPGWLSLVTL